MKRGEHIDEGTVLLMEHLKGRAFYFVYGAFSQNGQFTKVGRITQKIKLEARLKQNWTSRSYYSRLTR